MDTRFWSTAAANASSRVRCATASTRSLAAAHPPDELAAVRPPDELAAARLPDELAAAHPPRFSAGRLRSNRFPYPTNDAMTPTAMRYDHQLLSAEVASTPATVLMRI